MERDGFDKTRTVGTSDDIDSRGAVNSLILEYYKKFGRKRDLEQFFSLSTAQSDIKDTSGSFWRKMKSENDSSDSGGRKSESSHEVCRISIKCSLPEHSSSQDDDEHKTKTDSPHTESPPIIIEEVPADVSRHTDDESINFDDNNSQKSLDALLDLSAHKPLSPTSSITSQRKLEWDSLADVGYANESDRKNSASSLSTLERLALKQQYSNNDAKQDIGPPTSHSTPLDENDGKSKAKKGLGKKTTKIYKKDVDFVEVNVPHTSDTNQAPSINVNLTKHISFNVERDGGVTVDNVKKDVSISPEKVSIETTPYLGMDKEIQTSLTKEKPSKNKSSSMDETPKVVNPCNQKIPVMISLTTLRKRLRRKKSKNFRRKLRTKKPIKANKEEIPQEKSGEQLSAAESFEYMPGHMYHQNQMKDNEHRPDNSTGNKSSLESSGPLTTDSSKGSKHSLTKDLEKCIDLLKVTLQNRYDDGITKKKLIKDIVYRLVNSKYRDDESTTEFLSGLSYNTNSKKLVIKGNNTTSSTSDGNMEDSANKKPKKSILRNEKFNPNVVASTSQSAPNLFSASSDKVNTNLMKTMTSNTESDVSSRGKTSSENAFPKTSSEELYLKYLEALRREEAYKKHLKDKEMFLKQKLVSSETAFKVPLRQESKINSRLKDLMKDLTRNNYDDGSGDASKLEGGSTSNIMDFERFNAIRNQRSHSVFTLSSSHSECPKRPNLKKKMQAEREISEAGPSRNHYCCCPHHYLNSKVGYADSSVQVNIIQCEEATNEKPCQTKPKGCAIMPCESKKCKPGSPKHTRVVPDDVTGEIKYVCLCNGKQVSSTDVGDNFMIYKCSRLTNRGVQLEDPVRLYNTGVQCGNTCNTLQDDKIELIQPPCQMHPATESTSSDNTSKARRHSKSSQTNMVVNMCLDMKNYPSSGFEVKKLHGTSTKCIMGTTNPKKYNTIHEATRCLQTEISINPQIADPTLSDINIINNCDCAKLISEKLKRVSICSSESDGGKTFSDVCTNSTSEKLLIQSEGSACIEKGKKIETLKEPSTLVGKDYTIPIQGTNMTLTVNLGGVEITKKPEQVNECVVTEKISNVDEATSVNEETKSLQYSCTCVNHSSRICTKEASVSTKRSCLSKTHLIESIPNYNTYPKIDEVKEKPQLKRSNTDTDKLSICSCTQTDLIRAKDVESYNDQIVVIRDKPLAEALTYANALKEEKGEEMRKAITQTEEEFKNPKTDSMKSNENENSNKTDNINVGIPKETLAHEENKIAGEKFKTVEIETSAISTKTVGVETETEVNTNKGVGCQTDVISQETIKDADLKTFSSVNGPKDKIKQPEFCCYKVSCQRNSSKGPVIDLIQDITRRYSKKEMVKIKKNKCFSEIMTVLNYLLETEDSTDPEPKTCCSTSTETKSSSEKVKTNKLSQGDCCSDKLVDKSVQLSCNKFCKGNQVATESSDLLCSSDLPTTSSDSAACKVLNKIKKECEKYHQRVKCKGRKCEASSSTSVNCEKCKKKHHCACKSHKCKRSKTFEKLHKSCIAYNLIIETSESMLSEDTVCEKKGRPLKNIIVKVPKRKHNGIKEGTFKTEQESARSSPHGSPRISKVRPKSGPNESETSDEYARRIELATVREYLEQNRPDFVENTSQRQNCLKFISERRTQDRYTPSLKMVVVHKPRCMGNVATAPVFCGGVCYKRRDSVEVEPCIPYETEPCNPCETDKCIPCGPYKPCDQNPCIDPCNPCFDPCNQCIDPCNMRSVHNRFASERATQRDLLSLHVEQQPDLTKLNSDELRLLAKQIGLDLRRKKPAPKFISEREMKKHSEKIYKTLPEVVQKKEEKKKENIKKTNLLMANIFKKNLQKQALRGSVNLSNYSTVIKI